MIRYLLPSLVLAALLATGPVCAVPSFLVDADWLSEHRGDPGLVILDGGL